MTTSIQSIPHSTTLGSLLSEHSATKVRSKGNLENAEQLAQTIQQEVTRRQLGRAMTMFNAGQPVQFGPLTVTRAGLEHGRKILPWSQFAGAAIGRQGYFVVRATEQKRIGPG